MAKFFSNILLKSTYKSVYGNKARVNISSDTVEVVYSNRKIIHNKENTNKIEESIYDENKIRLIKYDKDGKPELEEIYVDGKKVSEKVLGNGKSTNVAVNEKGLETLKSVYLKNNMEFTEIVYKYHNDLKDEDYEVKVISNEKEIIKTINKKNKDEVLIDIYKKTCPDGRITYYKTGDIEIEIEYFEEEKKLKRYSKHWSEPVYEEIAQSKNKKNNKNSTGVKQQVGTKIRKEVIEYNKNGAIICFETEQESIKKEFNESGKLKQQYNIIDGTKGKEIVGKIMSENNEIKVINNSTLSDDNINKLNEEMDNIDSKYKDKLVEMFDFIFWDGGLEIVNECYKLSNNFMLTKKIYDKIENNVDYHIEEFYKDNEIYAFRTVNNLSKTEFYEEGNKYLIKGFDGEEKEVSKDEFELYKKADSLNKI